MALLAILADRRPWGVCTDPSAFLGIRTLRTGVDGALLFCEDFLTETFFLSALELILEIPITSKKPRRPNCNQRNAIQAIWWDVIHTSHHLTNDLAQFRRQLTATANGTCNSWGIASRDNISVSNWGRLMGIAEAVTLAIVVVNRKVTSAEKWRKSGFVAVFAISSCAARWRTCACRLVLTVFLSTHTTTTKPPTTTHAPNNQQRRRDPPPVWIIIGRAS